MRIAILFALLSTVSCISITSTAEARSSADMPAVYREAAEQRLLQADADTPTTRLLRLQLSAGRFAEAETTAERLADSLRSTQPASAGRLLPWRIHARSLGYEAQGLARDEALERAFGELFATLPDREMATALRFYSANLDQLSQRAQQAEAACSGVELTLCPTGEEALSARQTLETWSYLLPASEALIRADAKRRFLVEDDILVDTSDGARIAVMIVRPRGEALTALLNFTIYNREDWSFPDAVQMAAHGYAGVVAYTRGKGRGTGDPSPYLHDGADAAAVIDWLAAQHWSDGRVGMFSGSYNAFTQWAALKHKPRALRAIATNASNAPGIDTPMQGGVFQTFIYPWPLYTSSGTVLDEAAYGDSERWARMIREWFVSGRPYRDLERIDGRANPTFAEWLAHPDYDAYWQAMIPQGEAFADIDIPVYVQTGYFDGGQVGALHYMREHLRHRPDADHRMIVGPYHHTAQQAGVMPVINGYEIDDAARIDLTALRMQWFDHVFRGAPLPELLSDRVNFQVMGANSWRHVPSLEAMATERLQLFLGGGAGETLPLTPQPTEGSERAELRVDLSDRSGLDAPGSVEGLDTSGALLFETAAFPDSLDIVGTFTGQFEIVTNKRDLDLEITLFERLADGGYFRLSSHLGRARYRDDRRTPRLLTPGRPQTLTFESETITAVRLSPGSRLVALVGVPFRPGMQINYGTGGDVSAESIADAGEPLTIQFLPGSYLELGIRRE
ncbi:MAG: CocE/NonD family hydrolase [Brevundimonas sp.]